MSIGPPKSNRSRGPNDCMTKARTPTRPGPPNTNETAFSTEIGAIPDAETPTQATAPSTDVQRGQCDDCQNPER